MEWFVICLVAFSGSALTLFSGFGLGTILLPAFALFFPVPVAVGLTAVVHFLNNIFKLFIMGRHAHRSTIVRFGIPSVIAAFIGAWLLGYISDFRPLGVYQLGGHILTILPVKLIIGILLAFFALFEIIPALARIEFNRKYLPLGGFISGFFGGLSGHQGALRSAFLIRAGLTKEQFIASGIVIACLIDVTRLTVYSAKLSSIYEQADLGLMTAATLSAFAGAFAGSRLMHKITIAFVQRTVAIMLLLFSVLLIAGMV
jgi:uncharacterized protein